MKKYSRKAKRIIYECSYGWLELFGSINRWNEFFETGSVENSRLKRFDFIYQNVNQKTLEVIESQIQAPQSVELCSSSSLNEKPPGLESLGQDFVAKWREFVKKNKGKTPKFETKRYLEQKYKDGSLEKEMESNQSIEKKTEIRENKEVVLKKLIEVFGKKIKEDL